MIEHFEALLNIQVLSLEKILYTLDKHLESQSKDDIDRQISVINRTIHNLTSSIFFFKIAKTLIAKIGLYVLSNALTQIILGFKFLRSLKLYLSIEIAFGIKQVSKPFCIN